MAGANSGGLEARGLRLSYRLAGGALFTALDIDALTIEHGSAVGFLGPSGAGKTSLLYALTGIERPHSGTVSWGDEEITALPESERDELAEILVRLLHSFLADPGVERSEEELRQFLYSWLIPMLEAKL